MAEEKKARAAGVRKEDRLDAGLDSAGIVSEVKKARELDSTFRVYRKEWLFEARFSDETVAKEYAKSTFEGRLKAGDYEVRENRGATSRPWEVWANRWNVAGEWKHEAMALSQQAEIRKTDPDAETEVVARNSRREHVLRQYGILKVAS